MKNVFAVKYNKKELATSPDGVHFISKTIDEQQKSVIDEFDAKVRKVNSSAALPAWLNTLSYISLFVSIVLIISLLTVLQEKSITQAFNDAIWIFIILPVAFAVWLGIKFYRRHRFNKVKNSDSAKNLQGEAEEIIKDSKYLLGIPEDAYRVDTLHYFYTEKDGVNKLKPIGGSQYFNLEMYLFGDEEHFYLSDLSRLFKFSRNEVQNLIVINKTISIDLWNKEDPISSPKYQVYKIKSNSTGALYVSRYLILTFKNNDEDYEIRFPIYEKEALESVLNIKVPLE